MKMDLKDLDMNLTKKQEEQFELYYKLLVEWNNKINLTAITEEAEVYRKHFYDSLCLVKSFSPHNQTLLDVGSGAGFPSIPLKIMFPNLQVTIIDSLNKRIIFLKELCKELDLEVELIHGRAEEFNRREAFDIVTGRAVAKLQMLSELCIPFVKTNGYFIAMKGSKANEELSEADNAIKTLGAILEDTISYDIHGENRTILKFLKKHKTKQKYPRRFSQIKSNPL